LTTRVVSSTLSFLTRALGERPNAKTMIEKAPSSDGGDSAGYSDRTDPGGRPYIKTTRGDYTAKGQGQSVFARAHERIKA